MNDDAIHRALSPLRAHDPQPDVERLLARSRRPSRTLPRRHVLAFCAAAIAAGIGAAALPAGDEPLTARSVLQAAAAAAAEQPAERFTGIRYTRFEMRIVLRPQDGGEPFQYTRQVEYWLGRDGTGRTAANAGAYTDLTGSPHPGADLIPDAKAHERDASIGAELGNFRELSTDPAQLSRQLEAGARKVIGEGAMSKDVDAVAPYVVTHRAIELLSHASLTREQRRALFEVLAARPGARAINDDEVELQMAAAHGETETIRLVFDADTGAIASWSMGDDTGMYDWAKLDRVSSIWRVLESRDVDAVGDRS